MDRRNFLKACLNTSSVCAGGALLGAFSVSHGKVSEAIVLPKNFDEIDHFDVAHRVRDGEIVIPPLPRGEKRQDEKPQDEKELVIVGGGISGLTALSRVPDVDAVLLDKELQLGGNSRRRQANGIYYPLGAIVSQGAEAPFTDFFNDLAIPFKKIHKPELAYFINGQLVIDPLHSGADSLPVSTTSKQQFADLAKQLFAFNPMHYAPKKEGIFFPIEDNRPEIKALDKITLQKFYDRQAYTEEVQHFLDLVISSRLGSTGRQISAWMGLYILSRFVGENYTLPGGHGLISEALEQKIDQEQGERFVRGATVINVQSKSQNEAWVSYIDSDGELRSVSTQAVIMATPKLISKHIVSGLPDSQFRAMAQYQYSAYLVAQVQLSQPVSPVYETVTDKLFSRFIVNADWLNTDRSDTKNSASHLTIYTPYPDVGGRIKLYNANAKEIAQQIVNDLDTVFPGSRYAIEKIQVHRWGHPMVMPEPNIHDRLMAAKQPWRNMFFAHSDNMGVSGLYSAVWAGMDAYTSALLHLEEQSYINETIS